MENFHRGIDWKRVDKLFSSVANTILYRAPGASLAHMLYIFEHVWPEVPSPYAHASAVSVHVRADGIGVKCHEDDLLQRSGYYSKLDEFSVRAKTFAKIEDTVFQKDIAVPQRLTVNIMNLCQVVLYNKRRIGNHAQD